MNFLRLGDYLLSILFENDDIIAVDKPYGINSHTNESKVGNLDFIQEGLIEIFERQLGQKLHVIHRLDQTTTGVIIFGKSVEAAKKYAEFFFNRQVKKTYWFVTADKSQKDNFTIDKVIIHKGRELEAKTNFSILKKSSGFELWQANPQTGRNHQIRIHASSGSLPILGDEKYGGKKFPFLCLHNHMIEFPNGVLIKSEAPAYFQDLSFLKDQVLAKALFETDRRYRLFKNVPSDQCLRLVHNKNDKQEQGISIDQLGQFLVLSYYAEKWTSTEEETFARYAKSVGKPVYIRLMHNRGKDPLNKSQFLVNPTELDNEVQKNWIAKEKDINYEMRSDSGQSFGLFLDQRLQRSWVRNNSSGKSVLNLFSYSCGFSAAAALGGAEQVTSVDTNKNVLNWGKKNFEVNNLDPEKYLFFCRDSILFLEQALKKNTKYDLIICDPPSFSRGEKGVFKIETALETLLQNCLSCLNENGDLLFSTNYENFFIDDIRKSILKVQTMMGIKHLEINRIQPALDFELPGEKSILKSFLIRKLTKAPNGPASSTLQNLTDIDED